MNLEIRNIYLNIAANDEMPDDLYNFHLSINVEIGEQGKEGSELFYFIAASPQALENELNEGEYRFLRGYILMKKFQWSVVRRSIQNLVNHAQSRDNWREVVGYFNRYGLYASEDLDGKHSP